jgi:peptidoglycan hydrolase-like protein with peptidoglycan-binding domain
VRAERRPRGLEQDEQIADPRDLAARRSGDPVPAHERRVGPPAASGRSRSALLMLQRRVGNRQATKALRRGSVGPSVQRDAVTEPGAGAPLVGLKRGDGLDLGTQSSRPRVVLLQSKLNEKMVANLDEDGMFGPLTEEVLREFQESVDIGPQPAVDPATADLLMADPATFPTPGPGGETPHPKLVAAGTSLSTASAHLIAAGISFAGCGRELGRFDFQNTNGARIAGGSALETLQTPLDGAAADLLVAGTALALGDEAGIHAAADRLEAAASGFLGAAPVLDAAGTILQGSPEPGDAAVGRLLVQAAAHLAEVAPALLRAAEELRQHRDRREQIGDPIVGLRRGDGLIFGTFARRDRVKVLQGRLNDVAGAGLDVDGMFGPLTTEALQSHQVAHGLPPTERVDAATARTLRDETGTSDLSALFLGGEALIAAAAELDLCVLLVLPAGAVLAGIDPLRDLAAGSLLTAAGEALGRTAGSLRATGTSLQEVALGT